VRGAGPPDKTRLPPEIAVSPPPKPLVVLLEDDPLAADAMRRLLVDWGFECLHGAALSEVLPKLAARAAEVRAIISDDRLQDGASGVEALHAAQANGIGAQGLILTASLGGRVRAAGYPAMEKPVAPDRLRAWLGAP
jgi:DNA-binding NtrC family response regulator